MPQNQSLRHKKLVLAGVQNCEVLLEFMQELANSAADVRTPIPGGTDTLEIRKVIHSFLTDAIDEVRRIRKDNSQRSSAPVGDDA